ncbi:MAG TPA: hypothetical protein VMW24_21110 [Sedimentisphaerales bacterium]|nr:hypothetical protein [Sedimentisphaerales bacterium]
MGGRGLEQTALAPTKTPIPQNDGAPNGALESDFRRRYPDYAERIGRADLPEPMKTDLIKLLGESE